MRIEISQALFERLQKYAEPLIDDIPSVINKIIDRVEGQKNNEEGNFEFKEKRVLNLKHTKIIKGYFDTEEIKNWNDMLSKAHIVAYKKLGSLEKVVENSIASVVKGKKEDHGFHFLPSAGISIQRRSAEKSWEAVEHLAIQLNVSAYVEFFWRNKEGAMNPGQKEILKVN